MEAIDYPNQVPVPRMGTVPAPAAVVEKVWPVREAQMEELSWLPERLRATGWPNVQDDALNWWFKAAIPDRSTLFIRTAHTVGMFRADVTVLDPRPVVREVFVRQNHERRVALGASTRAGKTVFEAGPYEEEYPDLYRAAIAWGAALRAKQTVLLLDSDAAPSPSLLKTLEEAMPGLERHILLVTP